MTFFLSSGKILTGFFKFFGTREGQILLLVLAGLSYVQYQKISAAEEATSALVADIDSVRREAQQEWQNRVRAANARAATEALLAATEIAELKLIVQEIENDSQSNTCRISGDLLERLRAIQ